MLFKPLAGTSCSDKSLCSSNWTQCTVDQANVDLERLCLPNSLTLFSSSRDITFSRQRIRNSLTWTPSSRERSRQTLASSARTMKLVSVCVHYGISMLCRVHQTLGKNVIDLAKPLRVLYSAKSCRLISSQQSSSLPSVGYRALTKALSRPVLLPSAAPAPSKIFTPLDGK